MNHVFTQTLIPGQPSHILCYVAIVFQNISVSSLFLSLSLCLSVCLSFSLFLSVRFIATISPLCLFSFPVKLNKPNKKFFSTVSRCCRVTAFIYALPLCREFIFCQWTCTFNALSASLARPSPSCLFTFSKIDSEFCFIVKAQRKGRRSGPLTKEKLG